tara:strand:- start:556 stop:1752 length:1197 start_codon:yes stop_codon:yes gene_type:complete
MFNRKEAANNLRTPGKPLEGLQVLDFSTVYAGPICARMLADCGAEVVKVETPGMGDITRGFKGVSRIYAHFNAGKSSIAIDLKTDSGQGIARQLMSTVDVVVENYRPGVMEKFGLDYQSVKNEFPSLVYCSMSGFGQTGPFVDRAAYAPIAQASSGFDRAHMACQGDVQDRPHNSGIMVADILTGAYAFGAIQTALLGRAKHGHGEHIDVTMLESMLTLIPPQLQNAQLSNPAAARSYCPVSVKDGFVMVCIISGKNLQGLCKAMGRPELLEDERFEQTNRARNPQLLVAEIENWSTSLTAQECEERLNSCGVPCSIYNSPADMFDHPQTKARGTFTEILDDDGAFLIQNLPFQFTGVNLASSDLVAMLGQHTDEVLAKRLGLAEKQIVELRKVGVVA